MIVVETRVFFSRCSSILRHRASVPHLYTVLSACIIPEKIIMNPLAYNTTEPCVRYLILLASLLIQLCLGGIYAWSEFVPQLHASYGVTVAQTQLVFGLSIAAFTGAMVFAARLAERRGPRMVPASAEYSSGSDISRPPSQEVLSAMLVGIGVLAGIGTGFGYACPLPTCMRWFPDHRGLVTGIAVAGFGGGAVILAFLADLLMGRGLDVLAVFRWVGIAYGVVILAAAQVLRFPAPRRPIGRYRLSDSRALLRDPFFMALVVGIFSGTFAGLMVIGNLKPLGLWAGLSPAWATWTISVFAAGNVAGRIAWGRVADRTWAAIHPCLSRLPDPRSCFFWPPRGRGGPSRWSARPSWWVSASVPVSSSMPRRPLPDTGTTVSEGCIPWSSWRTGCGHHGAMDRRVAVWRLRRLLDRTLGQRRGCDRRIGHILQPSVAGSKVYAPTRPEAPFACDESGADRAARSWSRLSRSAARRPRSGLCLPSRGGSFKGSGLKTRVL